MWKFDKEDPQIFWLERGAMFMDMTRSEDKKYEANPTPSKTTACVTMCIYREFERKKQEMIPYVVIGAGRLLIAVALARLIETLLPRKK